MGMYYGRGWVVDILLAPLTVINEAVMDGMMNGNEIAGVCLYDTSLAMWRVAGDGGTVVWN